MKSTNPIVAAFTAIVGFARADAIVIQVAGGSNEAKVEVIVEKKPSAMETQAKKRLLPGVEFREATLSELAFHLRGTNPSACEVTKTPIPNFNFVVIDRAKRNLRIDISKVHVSLFDLLETVARKYGLNVTYDEYAIVLTDPK